MAKAMILAWTTLTTFSPPWALVYPQVGPQNQRQALQVLDVLHLQLLVAHNQPP